MSAAMKLDAERASFEAEYGPRDGFSWRNEDGSYKIASLQLAWEIWQKRAALDTSTPPQGELNALPELPWGEDIEAWMEVRSGSEIAEVVRAYGLLCRQSGDAADKRDAWQPIETAPKDGTYILLGNTCGAWIGRYLGVYQSGYRPDNPWQSMMLNIDHMKRAPGRLRPTHWQPLPPPKATP